MKIKLKVIDLENFLFLMLVERFGLNISKFILWFNSNYVGIYNVLIYYRNL